MCVFLIKVRGIVNINLSIAHAAPKQMDEYEKYFKRVGAAPIYLKSRLERDQALPQVMMTQAPPNDGESRRFCEALAFVVGLGEADGKVLPADVFRLIMDMLMARWDALRGVSSGKQVEKWFAQQQPKST